MTDTIPYKTLDKLRCDNCRSFLSCGPITANGERTYCGRCPPSQTILYGYDKVARTFKFPCRFWSKHCTFGNYYNQIRAHERSCSYRNGCCKFWTHPFSTCSSDRKMETAKSGVISKKIDDKVLEVLGRCYGCNGTISSSPIYTNKEHIICHRCSQNAGSNYNREIALEILLGAFQFPCINKAWGCPEYHSFGKNIEFHEQECLYKPNGLHQRNKYQPRVDPDGKMRGIIHNHRGPVWGTISPNHHSFVHETEIQKKNDGGLVTPVRKPETEVRQSFYTDLMQQRQLLQRKESDRNRNRRGGGDGIHRTPSHLKSSLPDIHRNSGQQQQPYIITNQMPMDVFRNNSITSAASSNNDYYYNGRPSLNNANEMKDGHLNQNYPAQLEVPKLKPIDLSNNPNKKGAIIRAGSYYDTNYNKVLKEFNLIKMRNQENQEECT